MQAPCSLRGRALRWRAGAFAIGLAWAGAPSDADAQWTPVFVHDVQGRGAMVTRGDPVELEVVVIGDFQGADQMRGFFIQEEDADADLDPLSSEGLFVDCGACPVDVAVGDRVRVRGIPSEGAGMSRLTATGPGDVARLGRNAPLPLPSPLALGARVDSAASYERLEGMLVAYDGPLTVEDLFELPRFGQLLLGEGRFFHATELASPGLAAWTAHRDELRRRSLYLDDDDLVEHAPLHTSDPNVFHPRPGFRLDRSLRTGDTITGLVGVLAWSSPGASRPRAWRIRPVPERFGYAFAPANPRPRPPARIPGGLRVASLNLHNYFTTLDDGAFRCGPLRNLECRGADSAQELARQTRKLVAQICQLDADVLAVSELENAPARSSAAAELALALAAAANGAEGCPGPDRVIETGPIGSDAIRVGLLYRSDRVVPVGPHAVLSSPAFVDPLGTGAARNRPALAQTFVARASSLLRFSVAVIHLKSKSCSGADGPDRDQADGQGCFNATRSAAAAELVRWLAADPTGSGDPDHLVVGDLNAYAREDPVALLEASGFANLVPRFGGADAYSYVFEGQAGALDHALASASLAPSIADARSWHANADESALLDYDDPIEDPGELASEVKPSGEPLFDGESPARASDHDPLVVTLPEPTAEATGWVGALALGLAASASRVSRSAGSKRVPAIEASVVARFIATRRRERRMPFGFARRPCWIVRSSQPTKSRRLRSGK